MVNQDIKWKTTFYPHSFYGHIEKIQEAAIDAEYKYFCWNGLIYETAIGKRTSYTCDDLDNGE